MYNKNISIREKIELVTEIINRESPYPERVKILGATKEVSLEKIREAFKAGIKLFGENRVQEAERKIREFPEPEWHMIGHLQKNKVKKAIKLFRVIESVDSVELAEVIDKRCGREGVVKEIFIEVNTSFEKTKYGFNPEYMDKIFERLISFKNLRIKGLFTLGPYPVEEKRSRKAFFLLRDLRDKLEKLYNLRLPELSMGMSEDFVFALKEGATIIRLGRLLFGERN